MNVFVQRRASVWILSLLGLGALGAGQLFGVENARSSRGGAAKSSATVQSIRAMIPQDIRNKGVIVIATDASYPPMESFNSKKRIVGADIDLAKAVFATAGMKVKFVNVPFDSIIPGLQSGKYLVSFSSFTGTKEREQAVGYGVSYFKAGTSMYIRKGEKAIPSLSALCGKTVAVEKGTIQADQAQEQSDKCTQAGKSAVKVSTFTDQNGANLAITTGRSQVGMADTPVAAEIVRLSKGKLVLTGKPFDTAPYDAFTTNEGVAKAMKAGLQRIMKKGKNGKASVYTRALSKWGLQSGAIKSGEVKINGAKE